MSEGCKSGGGGGGCEGCGSGGGTGGVVQQGMVWAAWHAALHATTPHRPIQTAHSLVCSNFWVPTLVRAILEDRFDADAATSGGSGQPGTALNVRAALLSALPYCAAAAAMVANAHHARQADERRLHTALPLLGTAASLGLLPLLARAGPAPALLGLTGAAAGTWAVHGPFFSWPAAIFMEPRAAALGFALVKTGGALGGFAGPAVVGALADGLHGFSGAMLALAGVAGACSALVLGEWHAAARGWCGMVGGAGQRFQPSPMPLRLPRWPQHFEMGVGSASGGAVQACGRMLRA